MVTIAGTLNLITTGSPIESTSYNKLAATFLQPPIMDRLFHEIQTENGDGPNSSTKRIASRRRRRRRPGVGLRRAPQQHKHALPLLTMELPLAQDLRFVLESLPDAVLLVFLLSAASYLLSSCEDHSETLNQIRAARREMELNLGQTAEIYHEVMSSF